MVEAGVALNEATGDTRLRNKIAHKHEHQKLYMDEHSMRERGT